MNNVEKPFYSFVSLTLMGWTEYAEVLSVSDEFKLKLRK